jgi:hypothetical protein
MYPYARALVIFLSTNVLIALACHGGSISRDPNMWPELWPEDSVLGNHSLHACRGNASFACPPPWELAGKHINFWDRGRYARAMIATAFSDAWQPLLAKVRSGAPVTVVGFGSSITEHVSGCFLHSENVMSEAGSTTPANMMVGRELQEKGNCVKRGFASLFLAAINKTWPHKDHLYINAGRGACKLYNFLEDFCIEDWLPVTRGVDLLIFDDYEDSGSPALIEHLYLKVLQVMPGFRPPPLVLLRIFQLVAPAERHVAGEEYISFVNRVCYDALGRRCEQCAAAQMSRNIDYLFSGDSTPSKLEQNGLITELARRYGWSVLSMRDVLVAGLRDKDYEKLGWSPCLWINAFMGDMIHPTFAAGARVIADALIHLLYLAQELPCKQSFGTPPISLPPQLSVVPLQTTGRRVCTEASHMRVTLADGWSFIEHETVNNNVVWKPGWVAFKPGARLEIIIPNPVENLTIHYLTSYEHMGSAYFSCESECSCASAVIEGLVVGGVSIVAVFTVPVTQGKTCKVSLVIRNQTLSGEHKFKVVGVSHS